MNKISRHNYEEYFILYMDNELDLHERKGVEDFVVKNPDLKEELDLLMQFKLVPDTSLVYKDKEELMSPLQTITGDHSDHEELLLLYLDNELSSKDRKVVQDLIAANPSLSQEWDLLQRTRIQPVIVSMPGKVSLYRKEENVRRMPMGRWRVAAAILLILLAGSITIITRNNSKSAVNSEEIAGSTPIQPGDPQHNALPISKENVTTLNKNNLEVVEEQQVPQYPKQAITRQNIMVIEKKEIPFTAMPVDIKESPVKKEIAIVDNNKPSNNLPNPVNTTIVSAKNQPNERVNNAPLTTENVTTSSALPSDIVHASLENDADGNPAGGKKNKLRGLLRKVTRTFEKRTNIDATDDDRLLVGGLAFKLK